MPSISGVFQIVNRGASYNGGRVTQESLQLAAVKPDGDIQVHGNVTLVDITGARNLPDGQYRITVEPIADEAPATE